MNKQILTLITIMLFLSSSTMVSATKIQKDDTWLYIDQDNNEYNETALEIIQLSQDDEVISVVLLNTSRPFVFDMNYAADINLGGWMGTPFKVNMIGQFIYNNMYATQEGGIPYITDIDTKANISIFIANNSFGQGDQLYELENVDVDWLFSGDPSIALTTTSSTKYSIGFELKDSTFSYKIMYTYIISSNSNSGDIIKNFTITPEKIRYTFTNFEFMMFDEIVENTLSSFESAMKLTYEEGINLPTYISQTESVKIESSLQLSQATKKVEYFLKTNSITSSDETNGFLWLLTFPVVLIVVLRRKNSK